jgi:hypothetical protein
VTTITVRHKLEEKRAFARDHPFTGVLDCLRRSDDIHTIRLNTRNLVSTSKVLRVGRATLGGGAHSVLVIFAYKHARKVPEFGHVERLKDLTLVARTITVESKRSGGPFEVFHSKSHAGADGNLSTNNTISTEETRCKDVHRATLSLGHADLAPEKLTNDTSNGATTEDSKGMAAVGGDDQVFLSYRRLKAD